MPYASKRATVSVNMYSEAYENYGKSLGENQPVVILGNVMRGDDGARLNVKECHALDAHLPGAVREITWLLHPEHRELPDFLKKLRATVVLDPACGSGNFLYVALKQILDLEKKVSVFAASNGLSGLLPRTSP